MTRLRVLLAVALALALAPVAATAQAGTVRGRVVEQGSNSPLQGVSVSVVGGGPTAVTNQEGRFALSNVPAGTRTLRAARIGYGAQTRSVTVGAEPIEVNFALGTDVLGLDEIVVIGYGQVERRRAGGGAISSIRPTEVTESAPTPTVENVLQGRVAGVQVVQNSGVPGSAISVRVRGASSISAGNEPLYVIDGVPLIQGNFSTIQGAIGQTQGIDALSDLNPNEIESIEVLKDASAAAIYGSRASNGVVLISTKRGRAGERPDIRVQTYMGSQEAWRHADFLNAEEYIEVYNEGWANDGYLDAFEIPLFAPEGQDGALTYDPDVSTDWIDEILTTAPMSNVFASIAGGTERARYYVSGTRFLQDGIVSGYGFERMNGRLNLDYTASSRLTLGTGVALTRGVIERSRGDNTIYGPFANAIASAPIDPVRDEDGDYNLNTLAYVNPVALNELNRAEERTFHVLGNIFADYRLFEGVTARLNMGLDQYSLRGFLYDSPTVPPGSGSNGYGQVGNSFATKVLAEGTLSWQRDLGDIHNLSGVVGSGYEDNDSEFNSVFGTQFPSGLKQLASAATVTGGNSSLSEYNLLSFFGRVQHSFRDRLTTTFNVRADGSSRFGENNRWGVFPSAAVQYRLTEEPFIRDNRFISDLAFRASYGRTGNQEGLGDFAPSALFTAGQNYNDRPGIAPLQLANPDLSWEKTDQLNIGADLGFFDDRLGLTFDWYQKYTSDLLLNRPIPLSTGFGLITENIGEMRNTGVELAVRAQPIRAASRGGLEWSTEFNISHNENVVTKLYNEQPISGSFVARVEEDEELGFFRGYVMDGIFQSEDEICYDTTGADCEEGFGYQSDFTVPGDVRFRDLNGDGLITSEDQGKIGSPWPDYTGGWTNNLSLAGFDLTVFTQFSQGNDIYNGNREYTDAFGTFIDNNSGRARNRWTPENPSTTEARATYDDSNNNVRSSSRFVEDGSYVRIKNAVLGYNLPARFSTRAGVSSMRLYVQAQNLKTWTDYSGFDPEVNFNGAASITRGIDFYTLPQARTYTIGLNLGF
ncbi:MAG TPA: TonB-dependent receptor [Longimicrobium sp.]|jgi:TonB-linked SusC/RagA family outer membrane protein|uniref:SusC/RagA family TonB-linked outer membrane protein n=1 Tax=Longimicrobium sp. TaxID=2029185 RepID=UPI002EDAB069